MFDMSKTVLANVDGFTPVIDDIVKDVGLMSAVVFGRMWRFCQMKDGVCNASLEKMAEEIGIDRATVMRHAKNLCEAGYLKDLTPELRNHPHTYADTGKVMIHLKWGVAQNNSKKDGVADGNTTVAESNVTVAESKLKRVSKRVSKKVKEGASATPKASDIPELVLYKSVVKHWCKQSQREIVVSAIQKVNQRLGRDATIDDLTPFWTAWAKVSGNEWSLVWLDEWAVSGQIGNRNNGVKQNANSQPSNPNIYTASDYELAARIRAQRGLS